MIILSRVDGHYTLLQGHAINGFLIPFFVIRLATTSDASGRLSVSPCVSPNCYV